MRPVVSFVVVMLLAGATLEGQEHAPAKPVVAPSKPTVAPVKPAVSIATTGKAEAPKPEPAKAAAPAAPAAPAAAAAAPPKRTLEEAAEAIVAALKARGQRPATRALSLAGVPAEPRAVRMKRYAVRWPENDVTWDVRWPVSSTRVALSWDEPAPLTWEEPEAPVPSGPASD